MIIVPFIFFTILTIYWWIKHQGLDICVYMSALYAFTALCGIVVILSGDMLGYGGILFTELNVTLGVIPTFLFCGLLFIGIAPFSLIYNKDIKNIKPTNSLFLESFCWVMIFIFLLNVYLVIDSTAEILSGDLSAVRADHFKGFLSPAEIKANSMPIIFRYFLYLNHATILTLPLFFYFSCCGDKPSWFKALLLAASLTKPMVGIQAADRTEFVLYTLMFIFCLIFFWHMFSRSFKHKLFLASVPSVFIMSVYFVSVSLVRFGGTSGDSEKTINGAVEYAGQNYLNFCYFWEYGNKGEITTERTFPYLTYLLTKEESNAVRRDKRSAELGFFMSVFATYIGDVMLDLSPIGAIIWAFAFFVLCISVIRYSHREDYDAGDILAIFVLATIPIFGIFYYRYYSPQYMYMFVLVIMINCFEKKKIVFI